MCNICKLALSICTFTEWRLRAVFVVMSFATCHCPIGIIQLSFANFSYSAWHGTVECRFAECHFAKRHFAECQFAECQIAECHFADCQFANCHLAECQCAEWVAKNKGNWCCCSANWHSAKWHSVIWHLANWHSAKCRSAKWHSVNWHSAKWHSAIVRTPSDLQLMQ